MSDANNTLVSNLALQIGEVAGALSRPGVAAQLVEVLRQPDAVRFSLPAVTALHVRLGEVLTAVAKQDA